MLRAVVFDWLPEGKGSSYILDLFLLGELVEGEEVHPRPFVGVSQKSIFK